MLSILFTILLSTILLEQALSVSAPCAYSFDRKKATFLKYPVALPEDAKSLSPNFKIENATEPYRSRTMKEFEVLRIYHDMESGYYVDLGASHWDVDSNTFVMDYFNKWKGICVEPNPLFTVGLLSNRRCFVITSAVGKANGDVSVITFPVSTEVSLLKSDVQMRKDDIMVAQRNATTTTLTTLLKFFKAPRYMEYLSLESVGHDDEVLLGLDPRKYTFYIITIDRPKYRTHQILVKYGYRFLRQITPFGECIYVHLQKPDIALLFAANIDPHLIPTWHDTQHPFLLKPTWNQSTTSK